MWLLTSFVCFVLCLECPLLVNVAAESPSMISRSSAWDCSSDTECTLDDSSCVNGYCVCAGGYIYNTDMTACIPVATAYGDACTETLQCSTLLLTGGVCADGVCTCNDGYHYTRGRCYASVGLGEACTADVNCYVNADTEATSCVDGVCKCSDGFYQREYRTCRRGGYAVGDDCAIDIDCRFENSVCSSAFVCALSTATIADNSVDGTEDDSRVERNLPRVDEVAVVGTECVSDENCATLANSRCGPAGTCVCNRAFFASTDLTTCVAEMGEDCSEDDSVSITNSLCRNGTWSCGYSTVTSVNQRICRKSTKSYNFSCVYREQCYIFGPDASCTGGRCLCDEGSHHVEDLKYCWVSRGISESCEADEDCYVEGYELTCTDSVCTCPEGTTPSSDKTICKTVDGKLGGVCEEDSDCTAQNSVCIDSVCACPANFFVIDDYCGAGNNATCSTESDCIVANSTCSRVLDTEESVCDCAEDYIQHTADSCLPVASYGEECESDLQCSTALSNTYCSVSNSTETSACLCKSGYHYRFDACHVKTPIGGPCSFLGDCYVENGLEEVVCRKGVCACSWGSSVDGTTSCSRVGSDGQTFFLSTWLGLTLLGVKIFLV